LKIVLFVESIFITLPRSALPTFEKVSDKKQGCKKIRNLQGQDNTTSSTENQAIKICKQSHLLFLIYTV